MSIMIMLLPGKLLQTRSQSKQNLFLFLPRVGAERLRTLTRGASFALLADPKCYRKVLFL